MYQKKMRVRKVENERVNIDQFHRQFLSDYVIIVNCCITNQVRLLFHKMQSYSFLTFFLIFM